MDWSFLTQILILLAAAVALGALAERFKQSAIVGYLLAGTLVAPWIQSREAVAGLADLGVALLLFSIGLEFSWQRLKRLGGAALIGGFFQIVLTLLGFAAVTFGLRSGIGEAVVIGAAAALSSTAVVLRTLSGRGEIDSVHGRMSLGVLLIQDIAVVPLVLLINSLSPTAPGSEAGAATVSNSLGSVLLLLGKELFFAALLVAAFLLLARYVLPRLMVSHTLTRNRELPILLAVVGALGSAWAAYQLGLSPAMGAFLAGVILGECPLATQVRADVGSLKTLFMTLFFSSIGMLADLSWVGQHLLLVLAGSAAVIVGKTLIVWLIGRRLGMAHRHAIAAGLCLAQLGEFSFVVASQGQQLLDETTFKLLISVTLVTLLVTPYLIRFSPALGATIEARLRRRGWLRQVGATEPTTQETALSEHVIVIGFGPAGREVAEALEARKIVVLVIDLNGRTVMEARSHGRRALVGDGSQPEILEHAHVDAAREVVVTLPDHRAAVQTIQQVRAMAPQARIIARARYNLYAGQMQAAGAHVVVAEETSVGQALVVEVAQGL